MPPERHEMCGVMDTRRSVINKAKELARAGRHFRFFNIEGVIWECYQAEFLPSIGERAWIAEPIRIYVMHETPSEAQQFGSDLWSGIK